VDKMVAIACLSTRCCWQLLKCLLASFRVIAKTLANAPQLGHFGKGQQMNRGNLSLFSKLAEK
jgi:hypothetical protein